MKRMTSSALAVGFALCAALPLCAQGTQQAERTQQTERRFGIGLGTTMPMGDYGDLDRMGLNLLGVFETPLAKGPVDLRLDGLYSTTSHDVASGSTGILGGTASALYHFSAPRAQARPYILGGLGIYNVDFGAESQTKVGFAFGGGVKFGVGALNAFAETRYASVETSGLSTNFVPLTVGLMFHY